MNLNLRRATPTGTPETLIVKLPSADQGARGVAARLGLYEREVRAYRMFSERDGLPVPSAFFGRSDDDRFVLVLEDVAGGSGDQRDGCSAEEARVVIRSAAVVHARFSDAPELSSLRWDEPRAVVAQNVGDRWEAQRPRLAELLSSDAQEAMVFFVTHYERLLAALDRPPYTLVHGDLHLENVIFEEPGCRASTGARLVDWQGARRGCGVDDVAFFLVGSLSPEAHRREWRGLLAEYIGLLREAAVVVDEQEQERLYRVAAMRSLERLLSSAATLDRGEGRDPEELLRTLAARVDSAIVDLDALDASRRTLSESHR